MNACQTSNVLRTRGIETVSITREEFTRAMRGGVNLCGLKRKWSSSSHKLPKSYAAIMKPGPTPYKSPTPLGLRIPMTTFTWLQHYFAPETGFANNAEVSLGSSWLTRLLVPL